MVDKIGLAAGDIWRILEKEGEASRTLLNKKTGLPENIFYMGLGWLMREDKINYRREKRGIYIALKE
jgi:hypothetical protein